jgi:hypothetical protein
MSSKTTLVGLPHSFLLKDWDRFPGIAPGSTARGRKLVAFHRDELVAAGALVRLGRELVIMGGPYAAWLQRRSDRVAGFEIAPNAERKVV